MQSVLWSSVCVQSKPGSTGSRCAVMAMRTCCATSSFAMDLRWLSHCVPAMTMDHCKACGHDHCGVAAHVVCWRRKYVLRGSKPPAVEAKAPTEVAPFDLATERRQCARLASAASTLNALLLLSAAPCPLDLSGYATCTGFIQGRVWAVVAYPNACHARFDNRSGTM